MVLSSKYGASYGVGTQSGWVAWHVSYISTLGAWMPRIHGPVQPQLGSGNYCDQIGGISGKYDSPMVCVRSREMVDVIEQSFEAAFPVPLVDCFAWLALWCNLTLSTCYSPVPFRQPWFGWVVSGDDPLAPLGSQFHWWLHNMRQTWTVSVIGLYYW